MTLDQQIDRRADGVGSGADDVEREIEFAAREHAPVAAEGIELECGVAAAGDGFGFLREAFGRARAAIPSVGVGAQFFVATAAPQVVNRLIRRLADDVPATAFDT